MFAAYGGYRCACCGETNRDFLTIDHANGGGGEHRRVVPAAAMMAWLKRNGFPPGFQILCFNCNCGRGKRNMRGVCPHQAETERLLEAVSGVALDY